MKESNSLLNHHKIILDEPFLDESTAKLDLIMKKLDIEKKEVMHINDSHVTCEECGDYGHSATSCPTLQEHVNFINNNTYYHPQQNQGWNQQPPIR